MTLGGFISLTKRVVDDLVFNPVKVADNIKWDGTLPGFGCRVFESGAKSFILQYRDAHGSKRRITLGKYGPVTPDQAKKRVLKMLGAVSGGADPLAAKRAKRNVTTVEEAGAFYIEYMKAGWDEDPPRPRKKSWRDDERRLKAKVYPAFKSLPLTSLKRADVKALHKKIGKHAPYEANRVMALLGKLWSVAEEEEMTDGAPNPAHGIEKFHEKSRDRWITHEEMPFFLTALQQESEVFVQPFFLLMLLLGTRKQELLAAKWSHVDFMRREIRIPQNKADRPHVLPLSDEAVALFNQLPRKHGSPFIFPSAVKRTVMPMKDMRSQWNRMCDTTARELWTMKNPDRAAALRKAAAKGDRALADERYAKLVMTEMATDEPLFDVTVHDLRRTCGSWLATAGVSLITIGKILNHAEKSVTDVYARLAEQSLRTALDAHAKAIMAVWDLPDLASRRYCIDETYGDKRSRLLTNA